MTREVTMDCVAHIRAAAALCEQAGMLAAWATLLDVADRLLDDSETASHE